MIRHRGRAVVLLVLGVLSILLAILGAGAVDQWGGLAAIVLVTWFALAGLWMVLMALRGVRIEQSGVTLRYCIKRRFLPLNTVVGFGVAEVRNPIGERVPRAVVQLSDGRQVLAPGLEPQMPFLRASREDAVQVARDRLREVTRP